jgi:plastocyanin
MTLVVPIALLSLVTACGGSTPTATPPAAAPATTSAPSGSSSSSSSPSKGSSSGATQELEGELEATAFTITLKDASGAEVNTLKAGTYQVKIKDPSAIHNFHLTGPGSIDLTTGPVDKIVDVTWPVTLVAGTYTYECDPHANMKKTFTVT